MDEHQREIIRSNLHQVDLILRSIWRKAKLQIETGEAIQKQVKEAEEHKKKIYNLLDKEASCNGS